MSSFRQVYQSEMDKVHSPKLTPGDILSEENRQRRQQGIRRKKLIFAISTAAVLFLCSAATVTAYHYSRNLIWVSGNGFASADEETAKMQEGFREAYSCTAAGQMSGDEAVQEGLYGVEDVEELPREYDSLEEFQAGEGDLVLPIPDFEKMGEDIQEQNYLVIANEVMVRLTGEEKVFMLRQSDYSHSLGHSSSIVYADQVENEREYCTRQDFTYTVIDTVNGRGEMGIHAAISVNTYELIVDFYGYTEEEAFQILEQMDLSVYF